MNLLQKEKASLDEVTVNETLGCALGGCYKIDNGGGEAGKFKFH